MWEKWMDLRGCKFSRTSGAKERYECTEEVSIALSFGYVSGYRYMIIASKLFKLFRIDRVSSGLDFE